MNTKNDIALYLKNNDNFYIIVHKNPDGDCLGSAKALCLALRFLKKHAKVCLPNPVSERLTFMWDKSLEEGDFPCDNALCVDVASISQMGDLYEQIYKNAKNSICIDHHSTNDGYAKLNYVDGSSAAAGEIIYDIILLMGVSLDEAISKALLVAVSEDTGGFQYSNTSSKTHMIASKLYEIIPNPEPIMRALYATHTREEITALSLLIPSLEYHFDGKVCSICADVAFLKRMGADGANIDAWVGLPRSIDGVEVALIFKILSPSEVKLSLRSNDYVDVSALAAHFGGGGHQRAAGVTFNTDYETAKKMVLSQIEKLV